MWNRPEHQGAWEGRKAGYEDLEQSEEQRAAAMAKEKLRSVGKSLVCQAGASLKLPLKAVHERLT